MSGVLGAEPLGEGVVSNEVRARGRLSPSIPGTRHLEPITYFFLSMIGT